MEGACPPYHLADVRDQDTAWNGFDEEIIRADIQYTGDHARVVDSGEDEDGGAAELAYRLADLPAVHVRHHEIEQDDVRAFLFGEVDTFRAAVGCDHVEAVGFEQHAHEFGDGDIVINDKNFCVHKFTVGTIMTDKSQSELCNIFTGCLTYLNCLVGLQGIEIIILLTGILCISFCRDGLFVGYL